jgi:tRNA modification GTPase
MPWLAGLRPLYHQRQGTTRDIIQVTLNVAGYAVHLKDTAGLRISDSDVEKEGIRRAAETAREADIVVILIDAREANKEVVKLALMDEAGLEVTASRPLVMPVITKRDLLMDPEANLDSPTDFTPDQPEDWISIAAKTGEGLDEWYDAIKPMMAELVGDTNEAAMISRYRHRQALTACHDSLGSSTKGGFTASSGASGRRFAPCRNGIRAYFWSY